MRFSPATELAELEATQHEFNEYLSRLLYDPSDSAARQTAAMLNSRKLLSMASVSQLEVRAPKAGVVGDVRIHVGQNLAAGDVVLALLPDERTYSVMALLPARDAAFLKPGQAIDFELDGYPFAPQRAAIEFRTDLPISPEEARRFLGPSVSDTFTLDEPMVIVEALLPTNRFRADGRELPLHDGMLGRARVELRSRRTLGAFFPALRVAEAP